MPSVTRSLLVVTLFICLVVGLRREYRSAGLSNDDKEWRIVDRVESSNELSVRLALYQRNLDILEETLLKVSDPKHPEFHQYWTKEAVQELVSPEPFKQNLVVHWALKSGCSSAVSYGDYVDVVCQTSVLEQMLGDVEIFWVEDVRLRQVSAKIPTGTYSLPSEIGSVVQFVQNIAMFVHKRHMVSYARPRYEAPSEDDVIPATLYNLYNISYTITTDSSQNVAEFTSYGYLDSDLTAYTQGTGLPPPRKVTAVGKYSPSPPDTECTLDIQMITAVGQNGTNFYWTVDGWVLDFAQQLLQYNNPPMVNSISWSADERSEGKEYNTRTDSEWQKLGLLGVSVLAASGDDGAVGASRCSSNQYYFNPGYPTTSPYVTSVGATMLVGTPTTSKTVAPVCSDHICAIDGREDPADENLGGYATGGGFSVYETRPSYQDSAVTAYLNDNSIPKPPSSYYDPNNRGFPDVAANGYKLLIYRAGRWESVGGTSASTPIWGGIFSIINDVLLKNNKKPLGFANPFLYQMWADQPSTFLNIGDLTTNNDDGCTYGYTSNPNGWDPVTGLGTPNVKEIIKYVEDNLNSFP